MAATALGQELLRTSKSRGGQTRAADREARAKLREAIADLAITRAAKTRGELVEADAIKKLWNGKLRAFGKRILAIPHRVQYLSARQTVVLTQELREALNELADDAA